MDKLRDILANDKVQGALKEFGRAMLSAIAVLVVALIAVANGALTTTPSGSIGVQGLQPIKFDSPVRMNQTLTVVGATTQTGAFTSAGLLNADGGIAVDTSNFTVSGTTGAVVTTSSLTGASAEIGGGYSSTGCSISSAGVLQCSGASTLDSATVTTLASTTGSVTNLTSTNITGTLQTAAQTNITSVGTLPVATITDLTTTNITGTLATAAQTSVTSLGTLTSLTVNGLTKLSASATITVTDGAAFAVTNGMNEIAAGRSNADSYDSNNAGVWACVYNSSAQTIHLADSGNQVLASQWDAAVTPFADGRTYALCRRIVATTS